MANGFTATQLAILDVLSDGQPHTRQELRDRVGDELTSFNALQAHLSNLRKKLIDHSEGIVCELSNRRICYRHVRLILKPIA